MTSNTAKPNRRARARDRREFRNMPRAPLLDSNGEVVCRDRRQTPDRRLNNIRDEWHEEPENDQE